MNTDSDEMRNAIAAAEELACQVEAAEGDLESAYAALEDGMAQVERAGLPIEALVPAEAEAGLGFALSSQKSGRGFWSIYSNAIREKICQENGKLHQLAVQGVHMGAGTLVPTLLATLGLPLLALPVLIPISVILATTGIEAYCEWAKPEP